MRGCEEFAGIGDLFGFDLAKLAKSLCPDIGVHGKNLAERAHDRAVAEFAGDAVTDRDQVVLVQDPPGS
jgi:hypothetical protein